MKTYLASLLKLTCCLAATLCSLKVTLAQPNENTQPFLIGSYLTPGIITEDGTGMFNQLNNAIFREMDRSSRVVISSINRAKNDVSNGSLDAYFPELWENLPGDRSQYVVSEPIFYKRIVLFSLKDSGLVKLSNFDGKLLGAVQGYAYGSELKSNPSLNLVYQENDSTNIKLLLNQRIDGVLGGYPGTLLAVSENQAADKVQYDLDKPVAVLESFYVCKNDAEGVELCNAINKAIQSLTRKGVLRLNADTGESKFDPARLH